MGDVGDPDDWIASTVDWQLHCSPAARVEHEPCGWGIGFLAETMHMATAYGRQFWY